MGAEFRTVTPGGCAAEERASVPQLIDIPSLTHSVSQLVSQQTSESYLSTLGFGDKNKN